jgi:preprotein translocase subunit YajC
LQRPDQRLYSGNFKGLDLAPDYQEFSMFVTPAYAQGMGASPDMLISILPFVLIFVIMYFLIIRPQRTQLKKRGEMLAAIRRGDTVVTGGGLVGKVTKATDGELEVDLGGGTKVTALRSTIADVRVKGEPVANQNAKK